MGSPPMKMQPFHRGAEADLFLAEVGPWKAVIKRRVKKSYRVAELDKRIRGERTVREANALKDAKIAGVRAPSILGVDLADFSISMSLIEGEIARTCLDSMRRKDRDECLQEIGRQIGALHFAGLVHGDMTTSNIVLAKSGVPFLLDFGMSSHSSDPEDRGTDLHLLQRSISTSHSLDPRRAEKLVRTGYSEMLGETEAAQSVLSQRAIARRGRYFAVR